MNEGPCNCLKWASPQDVLLQAFTYGHADCARTAITMGANVHARKTRTSRYPFAYAILGASIECMQMCLDLGVVLTKMYINWWAYSEEFDVGWFLLDRAPRFIPYALTMELKTRMAYALVHRNECKRSCETLLTVHCTTVLPPDVIHTIVKHLWSMRKCGTK